MVESECSADQIHCRVLIRPNRSLSWRHSMWFIGVVSVVLGAVSLAFALQGFWMILPFAGLEVAALIYCTYIVADAGFRCEVVTMNASEVVVEKGRQRRGQSRRGGPDSRVKFPRAWARVKLADQRGWYPQRLLICASGNEVELGSFLADEEKQRLAGELKRLLDKI